MMRRTLILACLVALVVFLVLDIQPVTAAAKPTSPPTPKPKPTSGPQSEPKPTSPPTPTPAAKPTALPTPTGETSKPTSPPTPTPTQESTMAPTALPTSTAEPASTSEPTLTPAPTDTPAPTSTPAPVLVSGCVFDDRDGNGVQDSGEPGVGGVAVKVDGQVVAASGTDGQFTVPLASGGREVVSVVPPEGWAWGGEMVQADEFLSTGSITIALQRSNVPPAVAPTATAISAGVLVLALAAGLAFAALASLTQATAVHCLEKTYRRHKGLELEHLQSHVVALRRAEVKELLQCEDGWRQVVTQLLADALPGTGGAVDLDGLVDLSVSPAPRFTLAGTGDRSYLFTTSPASLRKVGILTRRDKPVPLDASLHPAARVEVQAVWEHLSASRLSSGRGTSLPRQAEWFLVVRAVQQRKRKR